MSLAAFTALGLSAAAQAPQNNAGFGGVYAAIDLAQATGNDRCVGCAMVGTSVFVTAAKPPGGTDHVLYELDAQGVLLHTYAQPALHATSEWGMRDLCTDGVHLAGGSEAGISILNVDGTLATQWNGQPVTQPITGPWLAALGGAPRGLAWDGTAAAGAGRFYAVDFDSAIVEFDVAGVVTGTFANQGWCGTGLALDPRTGNLWTFAAPGRGDVVEIDRQNATWVPTGLRIPQARPGSAGAGLSEATLPAGTFAPWATDLAFVAVAQGSPDLLTVQRVHLQPQVAGPDEVRLDLGVGAPPERRTAATFGAMDVLRFVAVDPTNANTGWPCWTIVNLPPESGSDGVTDFSPFLPGFGLLVEHRTRNIANTTSPTTDFVIVNGGIGMETQIPLNAGFAVTSGMLLRMQTISIDLAGALILTSTNEGHFVGGEPQTGIVVEAVGPQSRDADTRSGFWRVRHLGGGYGAIASVTLDWTGTDEPGQRTMVFDVDQTGMGGRHDGGNATAPGCTGTYRNGSDVATGLDYGYPGNHAAPCATGGENSGFTIDVGDGGAAKKLTYRFAGGQFTAGTTFEFDCDTDGGLGVSGDAMRGLWVVVQIANGPTLSGHLAVDPNVPLRSFVRL